MDLNEFAQSQPELYRQMNDQVNQFIDRYMITGEVPLMEWDGMVDRLVRELMEGEAAPAQSPLRFGRDRNRDRFRFRDFELKDLIRLLFLRAIFDRRRR